MKQKPKKCALKFSDIENLLDEMEKLEPPCPKGKYRFVIRCKETERRFKKFEKSIKNK